MGNTNSTETKNYIKFDKYYYIGDLNVDNLPHGRGLILYENGNSFYGNFIKGKKHGQGIYIDKNLTKYISNWAYGNILNKVKVKRFDNDAVYLFYYKNDIIDYCKVYNYISSHKKKTIKHEQVLVDSEIQNCQEKSVDNQKDETIDIPNDKHKVKNDILKYKKTKKTSDKINPLNDSIFYSSCESTSKSIGSDYISDFEKKEKQTNEQEEKGFEKVKENCMDHSEGSKPSTIFENDNIMGNKKVRTDMSEEMIMLRLKDIINNNTDLKIENYELWNKEQVAHWLSLCSVPMKWVVSVYKNNITGHKLNNINLDYIRNKLGILPYGQAIKLLQLIKNLRVTAYNTRLANTLNLEEYENYLEQKIKKKKIRDKKTRDKKTREKKTIEKKDDADIETSSSQIDIFQKDDQKIIMNKQIKSMINQKNVNDKSFSDKIKNGFLQGNTNIKNLQNFVINTIWDKNKDEFEKPIEENNIPTHVEKEKELNTNEDSAEKEVTELKKDKHTNHVQQNISMLKNMHSESNESESSTTSITQTLSTSSDSTFTNIHSDESSKIFHEKREHTSIASNEEKEVNELNLSSSINSKSETNLLNNSSPTKLQNELPKLSHSSGLETSFSSSSSEKSSETFSSSSFCSEHSEMDNFHNSNKIVKYSNNIYINSSLAFSYIYSFIIPPENLTFLYQIKNYYIRDVENDLSPTNEVDFVDNFNFYKNREIPKNGRDNTKPQKMKSRVFRGRYMGKDVAIKVLVGNIKNFTKFHKVLYKLYILRHTNIALIMGVSISYPFVFIIYEYVKNLCLFSYLHCIKYKHIYFSKLLKYYQKKFPNQNGQQKHDTNNEQAYSSSASAKSLDTNSSNMNNTELKNRNNSKYRYINKINSMFRNKNNILCGNYHYLFRKKSGNMSISQEHKNSDRISFTNESQNLLTNKKYKKKINKKLGFKEKIKINRPYAFPPLQEDLNFYFEKKKQKNKILFSYLKTHSYFKSKKCDDRKNKLSDQQIMKIIIGITLGCSYLEKQKVQWINLKPTNILLDESLNAKISDFGIKEIEQCLDTNIDYSYIVFPNNVIKFNNKHFKNKIKKIKIVNKDSEDMFHVFSTQNNVYKYNTREIDVSSNSHNSVFFWTAPEILKGGKNPSLYSDVYAYGIILWELMTSSIPFNYRFKSHLVASVGYAKEKLSFQNIPPYIKNLIKSCINRDKYKRPTFDKILIELSMIYEKINSKEEDALMSFMDG
ncbi:protein kinase, putative [Plasmodium chabaudi chabaudi]|uniref:Protein kinase, putative n=1 Tax=Plasmodium chabaudi chabaudi TaxID=31271 RepID=A0A1C6YEM4_PLACU|nr:protein kinase, putative [Plasmodium chabaudi chabaudi]